MIVYSWELWGIDIAIDEEGVIGIVLGEGVELFPFGFCAIEIIICGDSYYLFHGTPWEEIKMPPVV
jgi:hypothetical protein